MKKHFPNDGFEKALSNVPKSTKMPDSGFNAALNSVEKDQSVKPEKKLVPYEESKKIAGELWNKYSRQCIESDQDPDENPWGKGIREFTKKIPDDVLKHYSGHGISKFDYVDQLAAAINIMVNKSVKGYFGPLRSSGAYNAYDSGHFLVVSEKDKPLAVTESVGGERKTKLNEIGWEADIGAIIVHQMFYPIVEELQKMYPDVKIIKAKDCSGYFKSKS